MFYPVNLVVRNRPCVIVGGGAVAYRKAKQLLQAGARVTVLSPDVHAGLKKLPVRIVRKRLSKLPEAFLVIAATNDPELNRRISRECARRNILVNVVDQPELCTFTAPSVFRRGDLTVAISTNGASPAVAKRVRLELRKLYPAEFASLMRLLSACRRKIRDTVPSQKRRFRMLARLASQRLFGLWRRRGLAAVRREIEKVMSRA